jgi:hypothetical protein
MIPVPATGRPRRAMPSAVPGSIVWIGIGVLAGIDVGWRGGPLGPMDPRRAPGGRGRGPSAREETWPSQHVGLGSRMTSAR